MFFFFYALAFLIYYNVIITQETKPVAWLNHALAKSFPFIIQNSRMTSGHALLWCIRRETVMLQKLKKARDRIESLKKEWKAGKASDILPLLHYQSAKLYLKYNEWVERRAFPFLDYAWLPVSFRFPSALSEVQECRSVLNAHGTIRRYPLPGSVVPIPESDQKALEVV